MLYDVPINYDESGKLQHSLVCRDVVLCLCYQPPGLSYKHPNSGRGTASQAVYVVSGEYFMVPNYKLAPHITEESHPALHIKAGEIIDLEKYMNISTTDTAGPEGVMMIHINPLSGSAEFNCDVIVGQENRVIKSGNTKTVVFALNENVYVNDVELSLLNRVRLNKNSEVSIKVEDKGVCLILERKINSDSLDILNSDFIKREEQTSKWSKYHKYTQEKQNIYDSLGIVSIRKEFVDKDYE